jgi:hypothetical protein
MEVVKVVAYGGGGAAAASSNRLIPAVAAAPGVEVRVGGDLSITAIEEVKGRVTAGD